MPGGPWQSGCSARTDQTPAHPGPGPQTCQTAMLHRQNRKSRKFLDPHPSTHWRVITSHLKTRQRREPLTPYPSYRECSETTPDFRARRPRLRPIPQLQPLRPAASSRIWVAGILYKHSPGRARPAEEYFPSHSYFQCPQEIPRWGATHGSTTTCHRASCG